ncbi:hypothetical protein BSKO_00977 [Bryopsis sp. KO-2023]|nr:hypothetical protein BSKO_00977 [Bryopsis sp. KO-2023]
MPQLHGKRKWTPEVACREFREGCSRTGRQVSAGLAGVGDAVRRFMVGDVPPHMGDQGILAVPRMVACGSRFASIVLKKDAPPLSKEATEELTMEFLSLPKEEQRGLIEKAMDMFADDGKVKYKGRSVSLKKLIQKQEEKRIYEERGGGKDTMNEIEENKEKIKSMDSMSLKPNADRLNLSPEEAAVLLDGSKVADGQMSKGFWGGTLFAYGLYAKEKLVEGVLGKDWAGRDPDEVLRNPKFYDDVINASSKYALTLLVVPTKRLSLPQMQREYKQRLTRTLEDLNASKSDMEDLDELIDMFDREKLRGKASWVSGSRVLPDTMLFFTATPGGGVLVEATAPGPVSKQYTSEVGFSNNPKLTYALFSQVMGNRPVDQQVRTQMAHNMLYLANGFSIAPDPDNPNQLSPHAPPSYEAMTAEIRPNMFQYDKDPGGKFILNGLRRYKQKQHKEAEEKLDLATET